MQVELLRGDAVELMQPGFSITPEALNAINVTVAAHELILPVVNSVVFTVADINESVVAAPAVRVNDGLDRDATANNGL